MTLLESSHLNHQFAQECVLENSKTQEYLAVYNPKYDFLGQSYASMYHNLHKYPATMLPQIRLELFKEFKIKKAIF